MPALYIPSRSLTTCSREACARGNSRVRIIACAHLFLGKVWDKHINGPRGARYGSVGSLPEICGPAPTLPHDASGGRRGAGCETGLRCGWAVQCARWSLGILPTPQLNSDYSLVGTSFLSFCFVCIRAYFSECVRCPPCTRRYSMNQLLHGCSSFFSLVINQFICASSLTFIYQNTTSFCVCLSLSLSLSLYIGLYLLLPVFLSFCLFLFLFIYIYISHPHTNKNSHYDNVLNDCRCRKYSLVCLYRSQASSYSHPQTNTQANQQNTSTARELSLIPSPSIQCALSSQQISFLWHACSKDCKQGKHAIYEGTGIGN